MCPIHLWSSQKMILNLTYMILKLKDEKTRKGVEDHMWLIRLRTRITSSSYHAKLHHIDTSAHHLAMFVPNLRLFISESRPRSKGQPHENDHQSHDKSKWISAAINSICSKCQKRIQLRNTHDDSEAHERVSPS